MRIFIKINLMQGYFIVSPESGGLIKIASIYRRSIYFVNKIRALIENIIRFAGAEARGRGWYLWGGGL